MLQAVVESTGAAAGALCLYDVPQQVLRLAAEIGLSDDGCRQLRTVRTGNADSWGMPLHGMLNRRVYLIENAAQNRFVPALVDDAANVATVACLPLYTGATPLASLTLITRRPRTLGERELRAVEAPMREIGRLIETMRQRALGRESKPPTPASLPRIGPGSEGAAARPPQPSAPPADTAILAAELARVERERDRLAAEIEVVRRDERAAAEARVADVLADLDRLRAQVGDAEANAAREHQARAELEARLAGDTSAARQELQQAHEAAHEAERARAAAIAESARLRAELERVQTTPVSTPPAASDTRVAELLAEIDQVRARLTEAEAGAAREQRAREELEGRLADGISSGQQELSKALAAAREAESAHAAAVAETAHLRAELEHVRQGARVEIQDTAARLVEAEAQLQALREKHATEVGSLGARLEALATEADRLRETVATISSERDRLAADLEGTAAGRAHLEETLKVAFEEARARAEEATAELREARAQAWELSARSSEAETTLAGLREEHTTLRAQHTTEIASLTTKLEALSTETDQLHAAQAARDQLATDLARTHAAQAEIEATLQRALDESRAREEALAARLAERDRELESARSDHAAEASALRAHLESLAAEFQQLRCAAAPSVTPQTAPVPEQIVDAGADLETPAVPIAEKPPRALAPATRPATPSPSTTGLKLEQRLVAVLDADPAWERVALDKHEVIVLAPDGDVVRRLEEARPARVVGNLAVPEVLRALISIREAGLPTRLWGCVADGAGDRALFLGKIEPTARPLAPDMVVASLSAHAAQGTRVVTVGTDTDALLSLRQALARQGMSVSMAWDAKQAADVIEMVHPGIVVVDLGMQDDACAFVARLAGTRPAPTVVLIEGPGDTAASFAAALADRALAPQVTSLKSALAVTLGRAEGAPPNAAR